MPSLFGRSAATPKKNRRHDPTTPPTYKLPPKDTLTPGPTPGGRSFSVPSRERTTGQGNLKSPQAVTFSQTPVERGYSGLNEFGALQTGSNHQPNATNTPLTPPQSPLDSNRPPIPSKFTFAPTRIPPKSSSSSNSIDSFAYAHDEGTSLRSYGFLAGVGAEVVLSVEDVGKVVRDVGAELAKRALTTPMLFSNQALELNATRTKALIESYLDTFRNVSSRNQYMTWVADLQFAKEHELAWLLRWSLSRIVRLKDGTREVCRGVLEREAYEEWRGRERAANYPVDAFPHLSALIPSNVYDQLLNPLFSLLSRFAAHSHLSGLTPHALSSLFSPLLFDMPTSTPCLVSHIAFVRAAYATEHLLLSYIRSSGVPNRSSSYSVNGSMRKDTGAEAVVSNLPSRLKNWVSGYPSMIASDADLARAVPRRGARAIRCERISRQVRAYSKDLISTAELWPEDIPRGIKWDAWERVVLRSKRGDGGRPKFTSGYRRKLGVKEQLPLPTSATSRLMGGQGQFAYGQSRRPSSASSIQGKGDSRILRSKVDGEGDEEARWGSLAGKEWCLFEEGGFDASSISQKKEKEIKARLQFDLNESAKMSVSQRRQTMDWSEFASPQGGFNRTDPVLDVSLTFASPLSTSIQEWPKEREELNRRLHKSQKEATPFAHDTTPRFGAEADSVDSAGGARGDGSGRVYIEEAFVDCWADWMLGGGWADREELTFKEANWALIEYKARSSRASVDLFAGEPLRDPRISECFFLFEERVPLEYQLAVANPQQKKTFATLFSTNKKKKAAAAAAQTLPIRSSRIGFGADDTDFERMLLRRDNTKKVTLGPKTDQPHTAVWHLSASSPNPALNPKSPVEGLPTPRTTSSPIDVPRSASTRVERQRTRSTANPNASAKGDRMEYLDYEDPDPKMSDGKASFFTKKKEKTVRRVKTDGNNRKKQKEHEVDFEIHSASGLSSDGSPRDASRGSRPDEEKWMDVLIANGAKRMDRQDATAGPRTHLQPQQSARTTGLPPSPHPPTKVPSPQPPARTAIPMVDPSQMGHPYSQGYPEHRIAPRVYDDDVDSYDHSNDHTQDDHNNARQYNYHVDAHGDIDPYAEYDRSHHGHSYDEEGYGHSPETSGSTDGQVPTTPRPVSNGHTGGDIQRWPSTGKRKAVPSMGQEVGSEEYSRSSGEMSDAPEERHVYSHRQLPQPVPAGSARQHYPGAQGNPGLPPVPPVKDRSMSPEVLAPRPRSGRQRDTIHDIMETYQRDSIMSGKTLSSEYDESDDTADYGRSTGAVPRPTEEPIKPVHSPTKQISGGMTPLGKELPRSTLVSTTPTGVKGRPSPTKGQGEEALVPPGPIFDLTPGREPSPSRYKHGEPLQFVGEDPEEDKYR